MSLDILTKRLAEADLTYTCKSDGSLVWPVEGRYVVHPFVITEEPCGRLRVSVMFPVPMVADVAGLCAAFSRYLRKGAVELSDSGRTCTLFLYSTSATIGDDIEMIALYADDMHAMLEYLRDPAFYSGIWDVNLIGLALLDIEECEGRA